MFTNSKYEELSYPKNQKMCDPILVTLLKMRPHYGQYSREVHPPGLLHVLLNCLSHEKRKCSPDSLRDPPFSQK